MGQIVTVLQNTTGWNLNRYLGLTNGANCHSAPKYNRLESKQVSKSYLGLQRGRIVRLLQIQQQEVGLVNMAQFFGQISSTLNIHS